MKAFKNVPPYLFIFAFPLLTPIRVHADPGYWISRAEEQFRHGDKQGALESFQQAYWERPQDPILHYNMGVILESLGRFDEAVDHYLSYLRWAPQATDLEAVRRRTFLLCGKLGKRAYKKEMNLRALDWYGKAKKLYPAAKGVYFNLGRIYEETRDLKQAEVSYKRYWELCKGKEKKAAATRIEELLRHRAEAFFRDEKFKEALAAFRDSRQWNAEDPGLLLGQARCEDRLSMLEKACEHYLELLRVDPENPERDQVLKDLDRIHLAVADRYFQENDLKQAEAFLLQGIRLNPKNVRLHYLLAQIYQKTGKGEQAVHYFEEVWRSIPDEQAASYAKEYANLCIMVNNGSNQRNRHARLVPGKESRRAEEP